MSEIFISYARSTEADARRVADAFRALGYGVWRDDELPAHRAYAEVIEERLAAAKAVVVIWSADAVKSEWVRSEANRARGKRNLVQLSVDGARLPMPFDQIQCADLRGWSGDTDAPGWRKVVGSIGDLIGGPDGASPVAPAPAPLSLPAKPSIAVLPLANLSNDPDQDYFADGMVEEITNALSRCKSIFVISAGSSLSFKGRTVAPQEAARELGVRYVLQGSVRRSAGRVRIAVMLVDAADGAQIWGDRFDDTLEDVFALQDRVAQGVAGVIEPAIQNAEICRAIARPTKSTSSYDCYLRALARWRLNTPADDAAAVEFLDQAIALDPANGPALALSAFCHARGTMWWADPQSHRRQAIELAHGALSAGGDDPLVLAHSAMALMITGEDRAGAVALIDRAIALNPSFSNAWLYSGRLRVAIEQPDTAAEHVEMAMRLDPVSTIRGQQLCFLGMARFGQQRFAEAANLLRESGRLNPFGPTFALLASTYGHLGQPTEGRAALAKWTGTATVIEWAAVFGQPGLQRLYLDGISLLDAT